ncbi:MAG: AtpZ/AtpI family protein [Acidimicrobiia bacterium]
MKLRSWATPKRRDEGEGFGQAIELAVSIALFAAIGVGLDAWLGSRPLWTITFIALAAVGGFASAYYRYQHRIEKQDAGKAWTRKAQREGSVA